MFQRTVIIFFTTRGRRGVVVVSGGWAVSGEREELDAIA